MITLQHRPATSHDLQSVFNLYMDNDANAFLTYDPMSMEEFKPIFNDLLKSQTLFIAEKDGQPAGTYRLIPKTFRQAHILYLGSFTVDSRMKGQGLGRAIIEHIQQESVKSGIKRIELTVDVKNDSAIGLYEKMGFVTEGIIRKSYKLSSTGLFYDEFLMAWIHD